jgi:hypothetical protein
VFIAQRFDFRAKKDLRSATQQAEVLAAVTDHRKALLAENVQMISSIKMKRAVLA